MGDKETFDSWKEIAVYIKRSVTTCRRLEHELGLPIHRLEETPKARVFAYKEEIDGWIKKVQHSEKKAFIGKIGLKQRFIPALVIVALAITAVIIWQLLPKTRSSLRKNKLAVLPFENLGSPEDEYFAGGITDEIMARLANIEGLSIIARNSSIQYKNTDKTIQEIGKELNVNYILTGTIRWQRLSEGPSRVRVTPQLVRISDATQVWANVYDKLITEVFQVQSDIAIRVVEALDIALVESKRQVLEANPTDNIEALTYYLQGNEYFSRGIEETYFRNSIKMYERAISLDPLFAQAYAKLSEVHAAMYWYHYDRTEERSAKAKTAADKVLQLDPSLAEAHIALGWYYYWVRLDYDRAFKEFITALKRQPNNSSILNGIGAIKRRQGRLVEALKSHKHIFEIDPRSWKAASNLGQTYHLMRKYSEAEHCYNQAVSLAPDSVIPYDWKARLYMSWEGSTEKVRTVMEEAMQASGLTDHPRIFFNLVMADLFDGKYQEALDRLSETSSVAFEMQLYFVPKDLLYAQIYGLMDQKKQEQSHYNSARNILESKIKERPKDSRLYSSLGIVYAGLGLKQEAIREAERGVELLPVSKEAFRGIFRVRDLALVYTMTGEYDKAIDKITYLLSIPGEMSIPLLKLDPRWSSLKDHPRFQKMLEQRR